MTEKRSQKSATNNIRYRAENGKNWKAKTKKGGAGVKLATPWLLFKIGS